MKSIMCTIGNTPLVKVDSINNNCVYAKLESNNPTGSIKDRAAYYMISKAVERGQLLSGATVVEPTSGNTGIGLAFVCRAMGFRTVLTLPENMSVERRHLLKAYGAELVLTPAVKGMAGAIEAAEQIVKDNPQAYMPMQFANPDNALAHFETTAPEVFAEIEADYVVCGVGSGGTAMGFARYIRETKRNAKVIALQPSASPVLTGGLPGAHKIQGIGANFLPDLMDVNAVSEVRCVSDGAAIEGARELMSRYGVSAGISAGANWAGAKEIALGVTGKNIVFIVPDNAMKYLSLGIYG